MTVDSGVKISERKARNLLMAREANKNREQPKHQQMSYGQLIAARRGAVFRREDIHKK